jgi:ankyrin repeat protein
MPRSRTLFALAALLLFAGAELANAQPIPDLDNAETPLHWAAENGLTGIAEDLIANGAVVSAPDQFGRTPLHLAVRSTAMLELLIQAGASVNVQDIFGRTPLHHALPHPESVEVLLAAGASVTTEDFIGNTPLERTLRFGTGSRNLRVVEMLIAAGAGAPREE